MNKLNLPGAVVLMFLTIVAPGLAHAQAAGTTAATLDEVREPRLSDLGVHMNPQLGVSSFAYSGEGQGGSAEKLSGGLTFEFGGAPRKMETGLVALSTPNATLLTIPMMAKLRVLQMRAQSWYAKFGFAPAFEVHSTRDAQTNNVDVLGSLGAGGRLAFTSKADFIIEATYNRGLMNSLRGGPTEYNEGVLVMAGMSFGI